MLETEWETPEGTVRVTDCMPPHDAARDLVRVVEGVEGRVAVRSELRMRFDYGLVPPWVTVDGREVHAVAGPDALWLRASAPHQETDGEILSEFTVSEGERVPFVLTWAQSSATARSPSTGCRRLRTRSTSGSTGRARSTTRAAGRTPCDAHWLPSRG